MQLLNIPACLLHAGVNYSNTAVWPGVNSFITFAPKRHPAHLLLLHMQAYIGFCSSIWSFNPIVAAWEPVMEPWDIILKLDANPNTLVRIRSRQMISVCRVQ